MRRARVQQCTQQRGLSLVELMIGAAVGLIVIAGALQLHARHLRDSRQLLIEARLQQELRGATDLIARQLRRSGYWQHALSGVARWPFEPVNGNPRDALLTGSIASFGADVDDTAGASTDDETRWGLRLNNQRLQARIGSGTWQDLSDPGFVSIESFELRPSEREIDLLPRCPVDTCPAGSTTCPPVQLIRSVEILLRAHASADPHLVREARETVRLRNDAIRGACPPA
jgi:type IV pilus assembly protein PilW